MRWELREFRHLTVAELYDILSLREAVFVVEQECAYRDADGLDPHAHHLCGRDPEGRLGAYCRILPPGEKVAEAMIGRVVVEPSRRGEGLGVELMEEAIRRCLGLYPASAIRISAQFHLRGFYESLGFVTLGSGDPYDEDGIPHVAMRLTGSRPATPQTS